MQTYLRDQIDWPQAFPAETEDGLEVLSSLPRELVVV